MDARKRPVLLALCGNDGAGKSTLRNAISAEIEAAGRKVMIVDKWDILDHEKFPECAFIKNDLERLRVNISQMTGVSRALFLFWSMLVVMRDVEYSAADVVILDGYWMKHAAAELVMGCPAEVVSSVTAQFPVPDEVFFLDVDIETSLQRKRGGFTPYECGCDPTMSEESFIRHQEKVGAVLKSWSLSQQWHVLDAAQSTETLVRTIIKDLTKHVPKLAQQATADVEIEA